MLRPIASVAFLVASCAAALAANDYLDETTFADKRELKAKGERSCIVRQYHSAYKAKNYLATANMSNPYARVGLVDATVSIVQVNVLSSGAVQISVREDTYPGSTVYFLIDEKRYSGRADLWLKIDAHALAALKAEKKIDTVWTKWPYRREINDADVLAGFTKSYEDCLIHMKLPRR